MPATFQEVIWKDTPTGYFAFGVDAQGYEHRIDWAPQPGSQEAFLNCPLEECLIEGPRGGGKTDGLLMDFGQHVGQGYGAAWKGILFRRTFPELSDVISKSLKWFKLIWPDCEYNKSDHVWTWSTGEQLLLRHFLKPSDYWSYHGHEYPWIAWEELTTWPTDDGYLSMMSCNRSTYKGIPIKVRSTTNPYGPGHNWVKKRFRLPMAPNMIVGPIIDDARNRDGDQEAPRVAIHSHLGENKVLLAAQPDYLQKLKTAAKSPEQLKAWIHGDWNIVAGGMFDDVWVDKVHVVPAVPWHKIPQRWRIDRSYDHGSSKPFSVGFWAESNGEPFTYQGRQYGPVKGDLFRIGEWYGWNGHDNEGVRMAPEKIAEGIVDRIQDEGLPLTKMRPGPADSSIFDEYVQEKSIAKDMEKKPYKIRWEKADKGPGSRIQGWTAMRSYFENALPPVDGPREKPGLFIMENCTHFIRTVPVLPRDENNLDDVDTDVEDHVGDDSRYRIRRRKREAKQGDF
jgi:hypothetical protein